MYQALGLGLFATFLATIECLAMTSLTYYSKGHQLPLLLVAIVIYGACIPFLVVSGLSYAGIGTVNLLWNIISTVTMIALGYYLFNEKINHLHLLSLAFGVSAIVLLYFAQLQE